MPKFSIIIPSYNRANILPRAIQSVFDQTIEDWEVILVDDGSSDLTSEVIVQYQKEPRFSYIFQENSGVCQARNTGASKAKGEWLIFLDSDDEFSAKALEEFDKNISKSPDVLVIRAGYTSFRNNSKNIYLPYKEQNGGRLSGTFMIDRSSFLTLGGYDTRLKFAENTELFFRIEQKELRQSLVSYPVMHYNHDFSEGSRDQRNMLESLLLILDEHDEFLSKHVKYLYHQNIGVIQIRFCNFSEARKHLLKAIRLKPAKLSTYFRFVLSFIPILAKRIYPENFSIQ